MKISHLAACILATTIGAVPLAYSMPGGGTQVTQYRTTYDYAYGYLYVADNVVTSFWAQSWDDTTGVDQGYVSAEVYDYTIGQYVSSINCYGPEYAGAVSVDPRTGNTTVNATLDPSAPECGSINVTDTIEVNLSGQADGSYHGSQQGVGTDRYPWATYKYNTKSDNYNETFTGSNGFYEGTFYGSASASRNNNRQKVK